MNLLWKLYMRIFPASKKQLTSIGDKLEGFSRVQQDMLEEISRNQEIASKKQDTDIQKLKAELESLRKEQQIYVRKIISLQEEILGYVRENNWGLVFNNTIADSCWMADRAFSFGRWAIGYQCAYVLFRVLDEVRPEKILELGLGQSTKILGQYACSRPDVEHMVIESDQKWIEFFKNNYEMGSNSEIVYCNWGFCNYKNAGGIRIFDGFDKKIANKKFDLIMIDAPLGGDMGDYARIDVLCNLPDCIGESFVIILDDVERQGESNTFKEMQSKLNGHGIQFEAGFYRGKKDVGIIVSEDLKFVLTM